MKISCAEGFVPEFECESALSVSKFVLDQEVDGAFVAVFTQRPPV